MLISSYLHLSVVFQIQYKKNYKEMLSLEDIL